MNDDYLISPEVAPGTKVSFMVKGISTIDLDETYQVMYSSTGRRPEDFSAIESSVATKDWTKVEVTLPDDARYFAIRYTASFQTGLMVDDIEYVSANCLLQLVGYDVFRNGVKLNAEPVQEPAFVDTFVPEGTHAYSVAAVYDRGSSNASLPVAVTNSGSSGLDAVGADCTISVSKGSLTINAPQATEVGIYRPDGTSVARITVEGCRTIALPGGLYIIKAGNTISKAVL